jgi:GxxExxY protein
MTNDAGKRSIDELTQKIIGGAYTVSNKLGSGFLEKVYENALAIEMRKLNLKTEQQFPITVYYDTFVIGDFVADLLVENCVLVELKTVKELNDVHLAQCMNYLKATTLNICLLINFYRPKVEIKRVVYNLK